MNKIAIIGGGASAFFIAANLHPKIGENTHLYEQATSPLQKVRISGGGRCNVTHACFDPRELVEFYPRGKKELLGVFHQFQPGDTMEWFESRNVPLKIEDDNRIFPQSNTSLSIIECFLKEIEKSKVNIHLNHGIQGIRAENNQFILRIQNKEEVFDKIVIATGSSPKAWKMIRSLGHTIVSPVPSLFTFNCKDHRIKELMGVSFANASVEVVDSDLAAEGPLLITHWGFSGPAILRLSAWGALALSEKKYQFNIKINFVEQPEEQIIDFLKKLRQQQPKKNCFSNNPFSFPKRFWKSLLISVGIKEKLNFADLRNPQIEQLAKELTAGEYTIEGKSTFKDEFVTAGGVDLREINFKKMESKLHPNLFFAGEVLNIDAITGGFNFQACWSEGFIIASELNKSIK
ncbi:NAD(P)/FAD-dependent oxidoreductase [Weeksella virosa]|uniref:NAD(P)/FAD-dependent oxidoreductase n=1 Tax=Weeksella virosa TaxID=1014 RepID=UPI0025522DA3|nr:NAD(P)/FAD-dependent oxidoreductase [Weeksella virosa]MDK7674316.1 NAD(P)/FAD-dependent oxidoreductase [Weeksella virosa]